MNAYQEPKYKIDNGTLVNRQSGEPIPSDEPVIVFRARDFYAIDVLNAYLSKIRLPEHAKAVRYRIAQFHQWAKEHPERMKEPDTQLTADWRLTKHD